VSITYLEAIREAQTKALREDPSVFLYGQDISTFGGAFKATKNLAKEFPGRVLDSPISEDAMLGMAIGAAVDGMRPIVEMQFADFSSIAFNQIVNQAATHFWRTGVPCPLVVRLPSGGTPGSGPFHSQNVESLYAHYPGLVVLTPATVSDAYWMLLEAITLNDPVIFCEHKFLYYHLKADSLGDERLPIGKARIMRSGRHATVVTYSAMLHEALRAAGELAKDGFDIGYRHHPRLRRPHGPPARRRRRFPLGRRHRRNREPHRRRRFSPPGCRTAPPELQRHADSLSP
jgi:acetoin:2,6-dichlorophenolindophenol oxidoreductase subunit beta